MVRDARRGEKLLFAVQQQMFHIRGHANYARPFVRIPNRSCFDGKKIKSLLLSLRVIANSWTRTISSLIKMPAVLGRWCTCTRAHLCTREMCVCVCVCMGTYPPSLACVHQSLPLLVAPCPLYDRQRRERTGSAVESFCRPRWYRVVTTEADAASIYNMCVLHAVTRCHVSHISNANILSTNVYNIYIYRPFVPATVGWL